ncbi:hypothetical protein TNCV_1061051 [Trichonephila clavipes]|nr:hypothetical protein TNCV_1061051 [Trichonephila clavipes]
MNKRKFSLIHELISTDWTNVFQWILSHWSITGNEKVDSLAKHAAICHSFLVTCIHVDSPFQISPDPSNTYTEIRAKDTPDYPLCLERGYEFCSPDNLCFPGQPKDFNFSSDNFTAKAGLYWSTCREMT